MFLARALAQGGRILLLDEQSTIQDDDGRTIRVLTDVERPLVFGKDGHFEYKDRQEHADLLKQRSRNHD